MYTYYIQNIYIYIRYSVYTNIYYISVGRLQGVFAEAKGCQTIEEHCVMTHGKGNQQHKQRTSNHIQQQYTQPMIITTHSFHIWYAFILNQYSNRYMPRARYSSCEHRVSYYVRIWCATLCVNMLPNGSDRTRQQTSSTLFKVAC